MVWSIDALVSEVEVSIVDSEDAAEEKLVGGPT